MPKISGLPPDDTTIADADIFPLVEEATLTTKRQNIGQLKSHINQGIVIDPVHVYSVIKQILAGGANITLTPDDAARTITIIATALAGGGILELVTTIPTANLADKDKVYGLRTGTNAITELLFRKHGFAHEVQIRFDDITSRSQFAPNFAVGWATATPPASIGDRWDIGGLITPSKPATWKSVVRVLNKQSRQWRWYLSVNTAVAPYNVDTVFLRRHNNDGTINASVQLTKVSGTNIYRSAEFPVGSEPLSINVHDTHRMQVSGTLSGTGFDLIDGTDHMEEIADEALVHKLIGQRSGPTTNEVFGQLLQILLAADGVAITPDTTGHTLSLKVNFDPSVWGKALKAADNTLQKVFNRVNNFPRNVAWINKTTSGIITEATLGTIVTFVADATSYICRFAGSINYTDIPTSSNWFEITGIITPNEDGHLRPPTHLDRGKLAVAGGNVAVGSVRGAADKMVTFADFTPTLPTNHQWRGVFYRNTDVSNPQPGDVAYTISTYNYEVYQTGWSFLAGLAADARVVGNYRDEAEAKEHAFALEQVFEYGNALHRVSVYAAPTAGTPYWAKLQDIQDLQAQINSIHVDNDLFRGIFDHFHNHINRLADLNSQLKILRHSSSSTVSTDDVITVVDDLPTGETIEGLNYTPNVADVDVQSGKYFAIQTPIDVEASNILVQLVEKDGALQSIATGSLLLERVVDSDQYRYFYRQLNYPLNVTGRLQVVISNTTRVETEYTGELSMKAVNEAQTFIGTAHEPLVVATGSLLGVALTDKTVFGLSSKIVDGRQNTVDAREDFMLYGTATTLFVSVDNGANFASIGNPATLVKARFIPSNDNTHKMMLNRGTNVQLIDFDVSGLTSSGTMEDLPGTEVQAVAGNRSAVYSVNIVGSTDFYRLPRSTSDHKELDDAVQYADSYSFTVRDMDVNEADERLVIVDTDGGLTISEIDHIGSQITNNRRFFVGNDESKKAWRVRLQGEIIIVTVRENDVAPTAEIWRGVFDGNNFSDWERVEGIVENITGADNTDFDAASGNSLIVASNNVRKSNRRYRVDGQLVEYLPGDGVPLAGFITETIANNGQATVYRQGILTGLSSAGLKAGRPFEYRGVDVGLAVSDIELSLTPLPTFSDEEFNPHAEGQLSDNEVHVLQDEGQRIKNDFDVSLGNDGQEVGFNRTGDGADFGNAPEEMVALGIDRITYSGGAAPDTTKRVIVYFKEGTNDRRLAGKKIVWGDNWFDITYYNRGFTGHNRYYTRQLTAGERGSLTGKKKMNISHPVHAPYWTANMINNPLEPTLPLDRITP